MTYSKFLVQSLCMALVAMLVAGCVVPIQAPDPGTCGTNRCTAPVCLLLHLSSLYVRKANHYRICAKTPRSKGDIGGVWSAQSAAKTTD